MRKLLRNRTYANVTATLALFVALGGSSYAAIVLPANSVGTAQIKKGAVALNRMTPGAREALKGQRGPAGAPGPAGPAGPAGTGAQGSPIFASVAADGELGNNSHATFADPFRGTGQYRVLFDRDLSSCAYVGVVDELQSGTVSVASSSIPSGIGLDVATFGPGGAPLALPFTVVVTC